MKKMRLAPIAILALAVIVAACGKSIRDTGVIADDQTVTMRVKTAFINDPAVGVARIDVQTFKGVVTLSGRVKSKDEEARAISLARTIKGVTEVKSTLLIEP
jgi:osmotically-inducible protein OsmY